MSGQASKKNNYIKYSPMVRSYHPFTPSDSDKEFCCHCGMLRGAHNDVEFLPEPDRRPPPTEEKSGIRGGWGFA